MSLLAVAACSHVPPAPQVVGLFAREPTWVSTSAVLGRQTVPVACFSSVDAYYFAEASDEVTVHRSFPEGPMGVPHRPEREKLRGRWRGMTLELAGEHSPFEPSSRGERPRKVSYELSLEQESGHLVGTRDGSPIRLAPAELVQQTDCGEPPP